MAMSKKSLFDSNEVELSVLCKALGHPARIKIIKILLAKNDQTCSHISVTYNNPQQIDYGIK